MKHLIFSLMVLCGFAFSSAQASTVVRNQYIVFSDRADFENYLSQAFPDNSKILLPYKDPSYARVEAIIARVWAGFQTLSPQGTAQLPPPALAILHKDFMDAYVSGDPKTSLLPNAFFMFERILSRPDHEIAGLIAHEITHLLNPNFKYVYYKVLPNQPEPLGFLQANDPQVEKVVKDLQSITEIVGPSFVPELNGLPAPIVYDGQLFYVIPWMATRWGDAGSLACQNLQKPMPNWRFKLALQYRSMVDQVVRMTESQRSDLDHETRTYISDLYSCLGKQQDSLMKILAEVFPMPADQLNEKYGEIVKVFDQAPNVVDGIFAVTSLEYQKLQSFMAQQDLTSLRAYSHEEIADDNSVRVLRLAGFSEVGLADFQLASMEDSQPGTRAQCLAILQSGKVPPYGMITDSHHAGCYRVYHIQEMAHTLTHE